jgi:hypothetical protein
MNSGEKNQQLRPERVMATVYLRSQSGQSLMQAARQVPGDVKPYLATPETVQKAISELQERGFTIEAQGVTLSISGSTELFEQVCDVQISLEEVRDQTRGHLQPRTYFIPRSSKPVMQIQGLEDVIEGLVLATPGVPFS